MKFRQVMREPLVHFLVLGALLFVIGGIAGGDVDRTDEIVVSPGDVEQLVEGFRRTWQRPPTHAELQGLVDERLKEEVFFREALAMGLDQEDAIIRRRLRQKLEFLTTDLAMQAEPTQAELQDYLDDHSEAFRSDDRLTFGQIYLSVDRRGAEGARQEAERLLAELAGVDREVDTSALGDPLMVGQRFEAISERQVGRLFGDQFAAALKDVEPGAWAGPVESGYGLHLVFVADREEGRVPPLSEIADAVRREVLAERRQQVNEQIYRRMLERYSVTVEWPEWTWPDSSGVASR